MQKTQEIKSSLDKSSKKPMTYEQFVMDAIWRFFNKELKFGQIIDMNRNIGAKELWFILEEVKHAEVNFKLALFLSKYKTSYSKISWN